MRVLFLITVSLVAQSTSKVLLLLEHDLESSSTELTMISVQLVG